MYECLDKSLQEVRKYNKLCAGLTVLMAGDWKQIFPVVPQGSRAQIVEATLMRTYIWSQVETLKLRQNIWVANADQDGAKFADYLGKVRRGTQSIIEDSQRN